MHADMLSGVAVHTPSEFSRALEARLADHVARGELLDLAGEETIDHADMPSWDDGRTISAQFIRGILRGKLVSDVDPHGLRLRGARIDGQLDLENLATRIWLELRDCHLPAGLVARDAHLAGLVLQDCRIEHPTEPPVDADRAAIGMLSLQGAIVTAQAEGGAVRLAGAHIGGQLDCSNTTLRNDSGPALDAHSLQVDENVYLSDEFEATGAGEDGAVCLAGAHIGGQLNCSNATLRNDSGPALDANGLQVDRGMFLRNGFEATGAGDIGAVRLFGAHIGGQLDCSNATLRNDSGPALDADRLQVDQDVHLSDEFAAAGAGEGGAVRLAGAHIGGQLDCRNATLRNESGPALDANGLQVDRSVHLSDGFAAAGAGENGAVRLAGAHIGDQLDCRNATLRNESGPALDADGLHVDRFVFLRHGFEATGAGEVGAVRLLAAHFGGNLECGGAKLRNKSGPALVADGLRVDQSVFLSDGFEATGAGEVGAVRLSGVHIGGQLDCSNATLRNDSGHALRADRLHVDENLFLSGGFEATGAGKVAVVRLEGAHIGGRFRFDPATLANSTHPHALVALNGLAYAGLPAGRPLRWWLNLLRHGTPGYAAQPYQQLATAHRAAGHDSEARRIVMAQRRDQIQRKAITTRRERAWARFTGLTLGYGYQPWRALVGLLAVLVAGVALAVSNDDAFAHTNDSPTPGASCVTVERIGVGVDLGLPLIKTTARSQCDLTATSAGRRMMVAQWILQVFAWAFATLFIAGFTGAVRKT
jgi:hypothetical protein